LTVFVLNTAELRYNVMKRIELFMSL